MRLFLLTLSISLLTGAANAAKTPSKAAPGWPSNLQWCMDRPTVQAAMPGHTEDVEDILELKVRHWGVEGFVQAQMAEDKLVGLKLRVFSPALKAGEKAKVDVKELASAGVNEMLGPYAESSSKRRWESPDGVSADLKIVTEVYYLNVSIPEGRCGVTAGPAAGLSDQEKKDMDAASTKKAVSFDAMKDDPEEVEKKLAEEQAQKKEQKKKAKEEKKKDDGDVGDKDIDW